MDHILESPKEASEVEGELIGFILGDGSVWKNNQVLALSNGNHALLERYNGLIRELYGFEGKARTTKSGYTGLENVIQVRYSLRLTRLLKDKWGNFANGKDTKQVTQQMFSADKGFKRGFAKGFWLADGSISLNRPHPQESYQRLHLSATNKSKKLLKQISKLLAEVGIKFKVRRDRRYWVLESLRKSECLKLLSIIGEKFIPDHVFQYMTQKRWGLLY